MMAAEERRHRACIRTHGNTTPARRVMPRRRRAKVEELYRSDLDRYLFAPGYGLRRSRIARRAIDAIRAAGRRLAAWHRSVLSTFAQPFRSAAARSATEGGDADPECGSRVG